MGCRDKVLSTKYGSGAGGWRSHLHYCQTIRVIRKGLVML
uniref:Uncharacterized protein n=1 Tax=Rhizophora mucronata TaxID=61149 RepID=A0A2P2NZZ8_RHIMU